MVLGICWLPDKVTLILNLTHLLNLDAELCYSWRLICNILIMLNGSLNPECVLYFLGHFCHLGFISVVSGKKVQHECFMSN